MAKRISSFCSCNQPLCACSIPCFIIGIGLGAFLTYPIFGSHPVKWGLALIAMGLLWYFYPQLKKK